MSSRTAITPTCSAVAEALHDPLPADLAKPTPCAQLDLGALVAHVVGTTTAMSRLGRGEPLDPEDPWGGGRADGDWGATLRENLRAIAEGWSREEPWEGTVRAGSTEMPATMVGEMTLIEVAVHGWDLARALGRGVTVPVEVAQEILRAVGSTAELGRQMGAYGPAVPVPDDAPAFDRALGAAGRDPHWAS